MQTGINGSIQKSLDICIDVLPDLSEEMKLTKTDLSKLECRLDYSIKSDIQAMFGPEQNNELFRIIWCTSWQGCIIHEKLGKTLRHNKQKTNTENGINIFTVNQLKFNHMEKRVKKWKKGDVLVLYVLSVITDVHCFVHLNQNKYWTSLKEVPNMHLEFMQRCNIHLAYFGQGTFI